MYIFFETYKSSGKRRVSAVWAETTEDGLKDCVMPSAELIWQSQSKVIEKYTDGGEKVVYAVPSTVSFSLSAVEPKTNFSTLGHHAQIERMSDKEKAFVRMLTEKSECYERGEWKTAREKIGNFDGSHFLGQVSEYKHINEDTSFVWYTSHRDSGLFEEANALAIQDRIDELPRHQSGIRVWDYISHGHWAVGHIEGYAMLPWVDGRLTEVFLEYCEIQREIEQYPVLDENLLAEMESQREVEILEEILDDIARCEIEFGSAEDLPTVSEIFDALDEREMAAYFGVENWYPDERVLEICRDLRPWLFDEELADVINNYSLAAFIAWCDENPDKAARFEPPFDDSLQMRLFDD